MTYFVFAIALAAAWSGFPPAPIFAAGAGVIVAFTCWRSRRPVLLRLGFTFAGCTLMHAVLSRLDSDVLATVSDAERSAIIFGASDKVLATAAVVVMFLALRVALIEPTKASKVRGGGVAGRGGATVLGLSWYSGVGCRATTSATILARTPT